MDAQALARGHVATAGNVFWSAARQLDCEPLLCTRWKRVLDATERAGPWIVRTMVDQVFGRLRGDKGPEGRSKRPAFGLVGQSTRPPFHERCRPSSPDEAEIER